MSESTRHTPGPWQVWKGHTAVYAKVSENTAYNIAGKHLSKVAECDPDDLNGPDMDDDQAEAEATANAALIADAPALLDALEELHGSVDRNDPRGWPINGPDHACAECRPDDFLGDGTFRCAFHAARALLRKHGGLA